MKSVQSNFNKTIVITGGLGFVGKNFLNYIKDQYEKIIVIDKFSAHSDIKFFENIADKRFQLIKSDIGDIQNYSSFLPNDFDLVNFAAESHVDRSFINSIDFSYSNYISTHKMLEHIRISRLNPRIIHISTDEVYGTVLNEAANEEALIKPTNPYSVSKAAADLLCQTYINCYGLNILIIRPNNIYGPYQHKEKLIPASILAGHGKSRLMIHGNGNQLRSFLHTNDFSSAIKKLLTLDWNELQHNIFNISSSNEYTVNEIVEMVAKFSQKDKKEFATYTEDRPFNDLRYFTSSKRLKDLGWREDEDFKKNFEELYTGIKVFG